MKARIFFMWHRGSQQDASFQILDDGRVHVRIAGRLPAVNEIVSPERAYELRMELLAAKWKVLLFPRTNVTRLDKLIEQIEAFPLLD